MIFARNFYNSYSEKERNKRTYTHKQIDKQRSADLYLLLLYFWWLNQMLLKGDKKMKNFMKRHKKEFIIVGGAAILVGGCIAGYRLHLASTKRTITATIVKGHEGRVSVIMHDDGWMIPYKGCMISPEDAKTMATHLNELADSIIEGGVTA